MSELRRHQRLLLRPAGSAPGNAPPERRQAAQADRAILPPSYGARGISRASSPEREPCPLCGGPVAEIKCKWICQRCGALVSNCNGD